MHLVPSKIFPPKPNPASIPFSPKFATFTLSSVLLSLYLPLHISINLEFTLLFVAFPLLFSRSSFLTGETGDVNKHRRPSFYKSIGETASAMFLTIIEVPPSSAKYLLGYK
ncbi:hypothetical protein HanRHA438_Chr05g0229031 [Helianthus annuus]|uniref:Uncharacterized protein n=1 Tax=Helianthus annuus TaxID=4232 RepID=A0A9K3NNJ4_HELAN|nr:hypothetical protein HanXRQr2_Chr05g0220101 [Helianthus annuus]KAJ0919385.1 hypothetical protein HanRHA438_Chr05g0229031 [Helianthus annuus]